MTIERILELNAQERKVGMIWNLLGAGISGMVIFVVTFLVIFLTGVFGFSLMKVAALSLLVLILIVALGLIARRSKFEFDPADVFPSLDCSSAGGYIARREINRVIGPAYVFSQFVLCTANAIYAAIQHHKKSIQLNADERHTASHLLDYLASKGLHPRFHPVPESSDYVEEVAIRLLFAEILWCKVEGNSILLGINRKYDSSVSVN
jgi:hypothetical protein